MCSLCIVTRKKQINILTVVILGIIGGHYLYFYVFFQFSIGMHFFYNQQKVSSFSCPLHKKGKNHFQNRAQELHKMFTSLLFEKPTVLLLLFANWNNSYLLPFCSKFFFTNLISKFFFSLVMLFASFTSLPGGNYLVNGFELIFLTHLGHFFPL